MQNYIVRLPNYRALHSWAQNYGNYGQLQQLQQLQQNPGGLYSSLRSNGTTPIFQKKEHFDPYRFGLSSFWPRFHGENIWFCAKTEIPTPFGMFRSTGFNSTPSLCGGWPNSDFAVRIILMAVDGGGGGMRREVFVGSLAVKKRTDKVLEKITAVSTQHQGNSILYAPRSSGKGPAKENQLCSKTLAGDPSKNTHCESHTRSGKSLEPRKFVKLNRGNSNVIGEQSWDSEESVGKVLNLYWTRAAACLNGTVGTKSLCPQIFGLIEAECKANEEIYKGIGGIEEFLLNGGKLGGCFSGISNASKWWCRSDDDLN
ncbi:hypothetical protein C8F04DRAFT_1184146 [Mycena alexandri]|uniref:Uncharacterized protein n=1 Tax=Mycena alexandri TaxID=1745969 RepID=A0AAD6SU56_9AGAR|nr:hypothetical protein C8F04DRAFT_1184146 [Mycena alexandri]